MMGLFRRKQKNTEVKRLQSEEENEEFETDASDTLVPVVKKSPAVTNHNAKKPMRALSVSNNVIHPTINKGQKEFVLQGFGPGKTKVYKDDNDDVYYHLRLNAISRGGKRGSEVHDTPIKWKVDPKWILPKSRSNDVTIRVDLSLYRSFPKDPMAIEVRNRCIEQEYHRIDRKNERKSTRANQHDSTVYLPIISENTYKIRFPDLAPHVVPHDINNNKLRDELYIGYGWAGDNESLKTINKKLHRYREVSIKNSSQARERREENIDLQRQEMNNYKTPVKPEVVETFDEYLKYLIECDLGDDTPPGKIPIQRIRRVIEEGSYPNWSVVEDELPTLLRYTWKAKQNKLIKYLRDESKHLKINNEDRQGRTALHYAASWGCINILRILLRIPGINVNKRDKDGKTPLYKAVENNSFECVDALMEAGANCRIPARDTRDPLTAIMHFYGDERFDMFQKLFHYGFYINDDIEPYFLTLIHKAIAGKKDKVNLKIVNFLIENGEDYNAKEGKSRTPLHLAAKCGRDDLMCLLLAHGANIFHIDDNMKFVNQYVSQDDQAMKQMLDEFYKHGPPSLVLALSYREADKDAENVGSNSNKRQRQCERSFQ